jgi:hypothetical protein
MYLYLYAPFLRSKKYARELALLEGRVTDFGITGKVAQLSQFLKFPAAIKEFGMKRLKTLVLVGDDDLIDQAVNQFALTDIVLGYIPIEESPYSRSLAIPHGSEAVNAIAARRITKLDVGRVEQKFFLGSITCEGKGIELHSPTFSLFSKAYTKVEVRNLRESEYPTKQTLEVSITPQEKSFLRTNDQDPTVVEVESCRLKSAKSLPVQCGGHGTMKTPLQVDIIPGAVRMVVGSKVKVRVEKKTVKKRKKKVAKKK